MMQELCGYIRKSVLKDGQPGDSPEIQRATIERWSEVNGPYRLVWFEDVDYTGLNENRPDWQRLLQYLPNTAGVAVYNYTKTHRNVKDYLAFYDQHIAPLGKILVDVTNPLLDLKTVDGRFMATVFMAGAEHHARKTSDLMKDKAHYAIYQKHQHWGRTPYGCDRDEKTKHLVPSKQVYFYHPATDQAIKGEGDPPDSWEVRFFFDGLRAVYDLYSPGSRSITDVAMLANAAGWRRRGLKGTPTKFDRIAVYRILQNWRLYGGQLTPGAKRSQTLPAGHPPILPVELTARVGDVLKQRNIVRYAEKSASSIYLLSGVLHCDVCGQWMSGQLSNRIYRHYRHSDAKTDACREGMVRCELLDTAVTDMVMELVSVRSMIEAVAAKICYALRLAISGEETVSRLRQKQEEKERLIDLRISGLISKQDYVTRLEPLQAEIDRLEGRVASGHTFTDLEELTRRIMAGLPQLPQASPRDRRQLVRGLFEKIFVRNKQIVSIIPAAGAIPLFSVCKALQIWDHRQHLTILNFVELPNQFEDILI